MNTGSDILHGIRVSQIGGWNVPLDIFLDERETCNIMAKTYHNFMQTADPLQSSMNILHDMGLAIVVSDAAEQNDICCPLNDIIMGKNVTLWSMNHMNVNHIDMDSDYTVNDGFESHERTEEMLRNGIFDVLKIKENTSPVNAENIYRMDSDLWRLDLGFLMVPVHLSVLLRQSQTIYACADYTFDQWFPPGLGARFEQYYEHHRHSNGNAHVCTQYGDCERSQCDCNESGDADGNCGTPKDGAASTVGADGNYSTPKDGAAPTIGTDDHYMYSAPKDGAAHNVGADSYSELKNSTNDGDEPTINVNGDCTAPKNVYAPTNADGDCTAPKNVYVPTNADGDCTTPKNVYAPTNADGDCTAPKNVYAPTNADGDCSAPKDDASPKIVGASNYCVLQDSTNDGNCRAPKDDAGHTIGASNYNNAAYTVGSDHKC